MQSNRLFEIIYILMEKKCVTASELAERFGVSTRTIYRDIDVLSLTGIPVYTEKGRSGGISLLPEYVLNKSLLSEAEQDEILSALQGLSNISTGENGQVLQRLSSIFNKTAVNWLEVDFSCWSFNANNMFNNIKTAILERRITQFEYYNTYSKKSFRRIEPVQLWFKSKSWYIKGFCLTKHDIRIYKLTRIKNLTITNEHFPKRDFPEPPCDQTNNEQQHNETTIKLHITPEMTHRVLDDFYDCAEEQPDGSFIITVTWPEDNWVYGTILSFGEYIEVLEPPHLRELIHEKSKKIAEKYNRSVST